MRLLSRASACFALAAALLAAPSSAYAHAVLERSIPAAATVVVEQPRQLYLFFSEQPELALTDLRLLDTAGRERQRLTARPVPGDARAVLASLPELDPGTFVVTWRTTSAVDGHTTVGAVPFTYGVGQVPEAISVVGLNAAPVYRPSEISVFGRFLTFTGAAAAVGALGFGWLVLWPALTRLTRREDADALTRSGRRALLLLGYGGLAALVLGSLVVALTQAAEATGVTPLAAIGEPLARTLGGTRLGSILAARIALALALGLVLPMAAQPGWPRWIALALGAGILLTLSLASHAAAVPTLTGLVVAVDWLHMLAATTWVGGIAQLGVVAASLTAAGRIGALSAIVTRFSAMVWVVATIVATGLIQSLIHVGSIEALEVTPYGQTLLLKVAAVAGMGMLGIIHWRVTGPRMRALVAAAGRGVADALAKTTRRFRFTAGIEAGLGIAVLLATGILTAQQPARDAAIALRSVTAGASADDLTLTVKIIPGEAGLNRYELRISPPPAGAQRVVLRGTHRDMQMGEQEIELRPENGTYVAEGGHFSMFGRWQIEPLVRRSGLPDARVPLDMTIAEPLAVRQAEPPAPIEVTPPMILGAQVAIFGVIVLVAGLQLRRRSGQAAFAALLIGLGALGFGGYTTAAAVAAEQAQPRRLRNPVPIDDAALAQARDVYQASCASCHGLGGRGDGPLGRALNPRPADFQLHVMDHPEGQLFAWISSGIAGTAMPSFREQISEEDRWRLVAFIQGFAENGPRPARTAVATLREQP